MSEQEHTNESLTNNGKYPKYPGQQSFTGLESRIAEEFSFQELFLTLWRRKWSVIIITLLGLMAAGLVAYTTPPVYRSNGTIIITESQSRARGGSDLENLLNTTYGVGMGSTISNELIVLKSRQLSKELADKVLEEDLMENGRRFPLLWRAYEISRQFPFFWQSAPGDSTVVTLETLASRIQRRIRANRTASDASVVQIAFESPSPIEAKWMVDQIVDTYIELSSEQNRMAASAALEFLEQERQQVERQLTESEERLRNFMSNTGLVQIDSQTESIIQRISDLESRRQEIRTSLVAINSAIETYEQQVDQIMPGIADRYAENVAPTLKRYQSQLADLETERLLFVTRNPRLRETPEEEPQLVSINQQIEALRQEISRLASQLANEGGEELMAFLTDADGNVTSRVSQLRNRLVELRLEQAQYQARQQAVEERLEVENELLDNLPDNMTQIARLRRDVQIQEQLFESISRQYSETSRWEQTQYGRGRPLDYGNMPGSPVKPRVSFILQIGVLFGGFLGIGFALLRERMSNKIDGVEKLKNRGYPLLSVVPEMIPFIKKQFGGVEQIRKNGTTVSTNWMTILDVNSPVSEAYRRLQNNILYSNPDQEFKTILVTSTAKREGKTTTTINLASVLAESGKKILLIDTDLRRPFVHKMTGLDRSPGLREVLFNEIPLEKAIQSSAAPNLDVLTAGKHAENPTSIIQSKTLWETIELLKEEYDHIVIDTAPYGIVADAAPIIHRTDGVVVVVRFAETHFNHLNQTLVNLKRINATVIGTLLTHYRYEKSTDYYSQGRNWYYYSYHAYEEYQSEISAEKKNLEKSNENEEEEGLLIVRDPPFDR